MALQYGQTRMSSSSLLIAMEVLSLSTLETNRAAGHCACAAYKPVSVPHRFCSGAAIIRLGSPLLKSSSDLPGSRDGAGHSCSPIWSCFAWGFPCRPDYSNRGALLPHLFTLTRRKTGGRYIFCGTIRSVRFQHTLPAVSRHAALRRPDFPPGALAGERTRRLPSRAGILSITFMGTRKLKTEP